MSVGVLVKETAVTVCGVVVGVSVAQLLESMGEAMACRIASTSRAGSAVSSVKSVLDAVLHLAVSRSWLYRWFIGHALWIGMAFGSVFAYTLLRMVTASHDIVTLLSQALKDEVSLVGTVRWFLELHKAQNSGIGGSLYLGTSDLIRRAENPFAFLGGREKALSLVYLHFRYLYVLLWPRQLSAEYAFDCIPKVSSLDDPRNAYGLVVYAGLLAAIVIGRRLLDLNC